MKTPTTGSAEDQLRQLFATLADSAPAAPDITDIIRGPEPRVAPRVVEQHRSVRWIASAAAFALALGGGLVWSIRGEPQNDSNPAQSTAVGPRLGTLLLPTAVPDGWQLVEISESASPMDAFPVHRWLVTGPNDLRALLSVVGPKGLGSITSGTEPPAATVYEPDTTGSVLLGTDDSDVEPTPDGGLWSPGTFGDKGSLSWNVDKVQVSVTINSNIEAAARALKAVLQPTWTEGALTYSVDPATGYAFEQDLGSDPVDSSVAYLTYLDQDGLRIGISLFETEMRFQKMLDPDLDDSAAVAADIPESGGWVSGIVTRGDVLISFGSAFGSDHTPAEAVSVLDSMAAVPESAWDDAADDISNRIISEPVIGSGSALGGNLSLHDGDLLDGICFAASGDTACRWEPPGVVGADSGEFVTTDLLVGGRWINVTRLPEGTSTSPIQIERMGRSDGVVCVSEQPGPEPDCGQDVVDRAIVTTDAGTFVVLSAPAGVDSLTVSVGDVNNRAIAEEPFTRPLR